MENRIQDMNVKELKALAKERGIKRYYWLRKAELIESLGTETPPTDAPATIMDEPATIMDEPATEIMDAPATEIMDEPVPEINKSVLSPTKTENISRVSSLVGLAKKQADLVNKAIKKFADWLINYIPEPIRRTVNTRNEKLKKEIKEILENKKKLPQQEVNTTGESSATQEVVTNKTEIKLVENGGRVKVFKTTGNLNFDLTDIIMEKITPIIETRTKVIHAFSCVIYRGQEIIEYSKTFKAPSGTFSSLDDIKEYIRQCEQKRLDLEDAETWSKAYLPATATYNSKGVYEGRVRFTSVSTKIILSNEPLLGCGPLPKWLADKKCIYAIDKIADNLCLWRCLAIHQRIVKGKKRPEEKKNRDALNLARDFYKNPGIKQLITFRESVTNVPTTLEVGNSKLSNTQSIANAFNNYFATIRSNLANAIPTATTPFENYLNAPICNSFLLFPTTATEIETEINGLNPTKSVGPFSSPIKILKTLRVLVSEPLAYLYNRSFLTGVVPEKLKVSKVIPVYKKGSKNSNE